jgi:ribosomal protein S4
MLVKVLGKKLKMCKLYETDLFGNLTIRPKKTQKFLNIIFLEKLKKSSIYKKLRRTVKRFWRYYRRFIRYRIKKLKRRYRFEKFLARLKRRYNRYKNKKNPKYKKINSIYKFNPSYKNSKEVPVQLLNSFTKQDYYCKFFFKNFLRKLKKYVRVYFIILRKRHPRIPQSKYTVVYYNLKKHIKTLFNKRIKNKNQHKYDYDDDDSISSISKIAKKNVLYKKLNLFFFNIKFFFLVKKKILYSYYLNFQLIEDSEINDSEIYHYFSDEEVDDYVQNNENKPLFSNYTTNSFTEKSTNFYSDFVFYFLLDKLSRTKNSVLNSIFFLLNCNKINLNFTNNFCFYFVDWFIYKINKNINKKITRNFIKFLITNKKFYRFKKIYKFKKKKQKLVLRVIRQYKKNVNIYSSWNKIKLSKNKRKALIEFLRFKKNKFKNNKKFVKSKKFYKFSKLLKIPKISKFFEISDILFSFYNFYLLKLKFNQYTLKKKLLIRYCKVKKVHIGINQSFLAWFFYKKKLKNHVINLKTRASLNKSLIKKKKITTSLIFNNKNFYSFFFNNRLTVKSFYYYNFWFLRYLYKYNRSYYRKKERKRYLKFSFKKKRKPKFNYRIDVGKPYRKKKKKTRYWYLLLTRHRLRYFASKISVHQLKLYIKHYRGSKFFGMHFLWLLESRIDFILYRLNLQISAYHARQYIKHVGVFVNEKYINVSSYKIKFNSILTFVNKKESFKFLLFKFFKKIIIMSIPYYIEINHRIMSLRFFFKPRYKTIFYPFNINSNKLASLGERFK